MQEQEIYHFTLVVTAVNTVSPNLLEKVLFQAGCTAAQVTFNRNDTTYCLPFKQKADQLEDALLNTIQHIEKAGVDLKVVGVEPSLYLVRIQDIVALTHLTHSTVSSLIRGYRGSCTFPSPVLSQAKISLVWRWKEVATWLYQQGYITHEKIIHIAGIIEDFNIALQLRDTSNLSYQRCIMLAEIFKKNISQILPLAKADLHPDLTKKHPRSLFLKQARKDHMMMLYQDKKMTIAQISKKFNIHYSTLYKYFKKKNVKCHRITRALSLNQEQVAEMMTLYQERQMTVIQICKKFNISLSTLNNYRKRENIIKPRQILGAPLALKTEQVAEMIALYQEDEMTVVQICKKFNITPFTVYAYLKRENIKHRRCKRVSSALNAEQIAQMMALYQENKWSVTAICRKYNISNSNFYAHLKETSIVRRERMKGAPVLLDRTQVNKMIELYQSAQASRAELCKIYKISEGLFDVYLKREKRKKSTLSKPLRT